MLVELSGQEVLLGLLTLGLAILVGTSVYKLYNGFRQVSEGSKTNSAERICTIKNRTKYAQKDFLRHRPKVLGLGLVTSLMFAIIAMSWTVYDREVSGKIIVDINPDEIEVIPPRMVHSTPPPPPPPKIIEIVEVETPADVLDDLLDTSIDDETFIADYTPPSPPVSMPTPQAPPPPPPPVDIVSDLPFKIVEQMPMFGNCTDRACSDKALMAFIYKQIKYPAIARGSNIEGRVTAEFIIERDGTLSGIKILSGIGAGCDKEVINVLKKMNKGETSWTPGQQRGKAVRVLYRLPVTFKLN